MIQLEVYISSSTPNRYIEPCKMFWESCFGYLMPTEEFRYGINQYRCPDLKSLEQKILQFPAGSTFGLAHTGSGEDVGDWATISEFLESHGFSARN